MIFASVCGDSVQLRCPYWRVVETGDVEERGASMVATVARDLEGRHAWAEVRVIVAIRHEMVLTQRLGHTELFPLVLGEFNRLDAFTSYLPSHFILQTR